MCAVCVRARARVRAWREEGGAPGIDIRAQKVSPVLEYDHQFSHHSGNKYGFTLLILRTECLAVYFRLCVRYLIRFTMSLV